MASLISPSYAGISLHFILTARVAMHQSVLDMFSNENQMENSTSKLWQRVQPNTVRKL